MRWEKPALPPGLPLRGTGSGVQNSVWGGATESGTGGVRLIPGCSGCEGAECHPALGCSHCSQGHLGTTELWRRRNLGAGLLPSADSLPPAFKVGLQRPLHWKEGSWQLENTGDSSWPLREQLVGRPLGRG